MSLTIIFQRKSNYTLKSSYELCVALYITLKGATIVSIPILTGSF